MQVIICKGETVMSGAQGPVPIFLLRGHSAVQFHDSVSCQPTHLERRCAVCAEGMVQLEKIAPFVQNIYLKLLLEGKERYQIVETANLFTSENQFVIFEKIISMFIQIDLKVRIGRMVRQFVVIGEGHDVIAESPEGVQHLCRSMVTFIKRSLHHCMGMEICPFPAI